MKRALPTVLDTLHALALALWLGGVALFWLLVTSGIEHERNVPIDAANALMGSAWGSLGLWAERCGIVMVSVQFVLRRRYQRNRPRFVADGVRQLITFGALLLTEYAHRGMAYREVLHQHAVPGGTVLTPNAVLMGLCTMQITLLVGITALTVWLHQPSIAVTGIPAAAPVRPSSAPSKKRVAK